ncbi:(R)-specific enoyl-CoA hydratase [Benincasa hispida]|uniref:(R)-specific enoyl-CoA hydratase n=1 Tax=Benincasa hispida TaxID=102211 RepID=UPI001901EF39|nr:(R)-specific enoyl-CoA hydratase [Benincasa hispida]
MLSRGLFSMHISTSLKCFSSSTSNVLKVGDILSYTRIFTSKDVLEYSKVSHDSNPLHFDSELARRAGFNGRLVHGMLVASMFPHIISSHFPGAIYVSQSLNFKLPVYVGENIVGQVEAIDLRENKKRYLAKFITKCMRNGHEVVLEGEARAIIPSDFHSTNG